MCSPQAAVSSKVGSMRRWKEHSKQFLCSNLINKLNLQYGKLVMPSKDEDCRQYLTIIPNSADTDQAGAAVAQW